MAEENGSEQITELEQKIIKQVEFYFGDINLSRDKFLQEQIKQDDGWVTLETMLKFNRLKMLTEEQSVVAAALKKSTHGILEVSEDNSKIRRSPAKPLPESTKESLKNRSIYGKGIPLDATLDQVMAFFDKFGPTEHVQMRRDSKKVFKGSCFVIYATEESAKKFLEEPNLKYDGFETEMVRLLKDDYFKSKNDEKQKRSEDKSAAKQEKKQQKEEEEKEKVREAIVSGAILNVDDVPKSVNRDALRTFFEQFGKVEWVDLDKDTAQGRVRYGEVNGAVDALEKATTAGEGKVVMNEAELKCRVLDGEDELEHWSGIQKARNDRKHSYKDYGKSGRKGGHKGGFKRKSDRDGDSQRKRSKTGDHGDAGSDAEEGGKRKHSPQTSPNKKVKLNADGGSDGGAGSG